MGDECVHACRCVTCRHRLVETKKENNLLMKGLTHWRVDVLRADADQRKEEEKKKEKELIWVLRMDPCLGAGGVDVSMLGHALRVRVWTWIGVKKKIKRKKKTYL